MKVFKMLQHHFKDCIFNLLIILILYLDGEVLVKDSKLINYSVSLMHNKQEQDIINHYYQLDHSKWLLMI